LPKGRRFIAGPFLLPFLIYWNFSGERNVFGNWKTTYSEGTMYLKRRLILAPVLLLIAGLACNLPSGAQNPPDAAATLNALSTAAARTIEAAATQAANGTPGLTTSPAFPTGLFTLAPTRTPAPVIRCDAAAFIADVSISDGTAIGRGNSFTKTWRLQNAGTCAWTPSYALVFVSGSQMGGPSVLALPGYVNPGQTVDLSVNLTAPDTDGHYRGYWKLRNPAGAVFGIGQLADTAFWVDINVKGPSFVAYDFVANFCNADWKNNNANLPCPGTEGDSQGYVLKLNAPKMENGEKADDPGLLTFPKNTSNGFISGQYPAFKVHSGDRFRALVNCQYNATGCDVYFRLDYLNNGQVKTLGSWHEIYEGQFYPVNLDLSALEGETVKFILVVTANGSAHHDSAIWVAPRIVRQGTAPTPTRTPTPSLTPTATPTFTPTFTPTSTPTSTPTP